MKWFYLVSYSIAVRMDHIDKRADESVYDEVSASQKEHFEVDENKCYGEIGSKPGRVVEKYHPNKVLSLLLVVILALLLAVVGVCVAFGLEIAELKSEHQQFGQNISAAEDLFSRQLGEDRSEFRNQIQQLNVTMQLLANDFIERTRGQSMLNPVASCPALPPSSASGYYWVRASNGSAVSVFCDMTRSCGGVTGGWTRVAELNMTNSSHQCPSGLRERNDSNIRTCAKNEFGVGCSSPDNFIVHPNIQYSMVCGRIVAYQFASTDAFYDNDINSIYVDGVSLTHGEPRQHIWTFAAARDEVAVSDCPCLDRNSSTDVQPPAFVGNDYFCDTGSISIFQRNTFYGDNPLWDGAGCGPESTCCSFNSPPWFYKHLPCPTTDGIEMRVCRTDVASGEDIAIELIDIYIQ